MFGDLEGCVGDIAVMKEIYNSIERRQSSPKLGVVLSIASEAPTLTLLQPRRSKNRPRFVFLLC